MTVPYTGVSAQIVNLAASMLSKSSSFRALVGAATEELARGYIVEIDDTPPVGPHAAVHIPEITWDRVSTAHVLGEASVVVVVLYPPGDGLTATESFRDALNKADAISNEVSDLLTDDGYELVTGINPSPLVKLDESEELAGWFSVLLTLSVRCMP